MTAIWYKKDVNDRFLSSLLTSRKSDNDFIHSSLVNAKRLYLDIHGLRYAIDLKIYISQCSPGVGISEGNFDPIGSYCGVKK